MRIAVVTTSYPAFAGDPSGHFVREEVLQLESEGHDVRVFRPEPGGAFGWPGASTRLTAQPARLLEASAWTARAAIALRSFTPERVIAHWCLPSAAPIALTGAPRYAPLEVVSHGGDIRLLTRVPVRARVRVVDTIVRRAERWRFVSEELLASAEGALPRELALELRRIAIVRPSPIDVPDVRALSRELRSRVGGARLYVCAGRLIPSKRVERILDYVATTDNHPSRRSERTLIVLGDGPERARLERIARSWMLDVRFFGTTPRSEALGWIGAADELVHASRAEGCSTVMREAERLGVPVTRLA
jgi:teichuronic acid biosynthesis glycosyltransferase TuaC